MPFKCVFIYCLLKDCKKLSKKPSNIESSNRRNCIKMVFKMLTEINVYFFMTLTLIML